MHYLLIRHAQTDANRLNRALYGKRGAPINDAGRQQAEKLRVQLTQLGIAPTEPVAVSELLRTAQTAEAAGLQRLVVYAVLNEVSTPDPFKTNQLIAQGHIPEEARAAARRILAHPPKELIWVTHGQVIAALMEALGQADAHNRIPDFCEIRRIEF